MCQPASQPIRNYSGLMLISMSSRDEHLLECSRRVLLLFEQRALRNRASPERLRRESRVISWGETIVLFPSPTPRISCFLAPRIDRRLRAYDRVVWQIRKWKKQSAMNK